LAGFRHAVGLCQYIERVSTDDGGQVTSSSEGAMKESFEGINDLTTLNRQKPTVFVTLDIIAPGDLHEVGRVGSKDRHNQYS
jgi:hypothetical protein